jgi:inorganic triphosphatase YgiF
LKSPRAICRNWQLAQPAPSDGQLVRAPASGLDLFRYARASAQAPRHLARVRQAGKKRIQTIKTAANGVAVERGEWEKRIDGNEPDLRAARGTPLQRLLSKRLKRDLDAVFSTHVHRTLVPLRPGNSRVELALDEGHIRAGLYSSPLAEVELELKSGSISDLFKTRANGRTACPGEACAEGQVRTGLRPDHGSANGSRVGAKDRSSAQGDARRRLSGIGRRCCITSPPTNRRCSRACPTACIRCGSACAACAPPSGFFSALLRSKQTETIKQDLKWLAGKLGPVRDLDVFLATRVKSLEAVDPPIAGLGDLVSELENRRAVAAEAAKVAIASARYRLLILNTLEWIEDGAWLRLRPALRNRRIKPFAAKLFAHRIAKAKKRAKEISKLSVHDRHKLRIAMKKLRYSIYFFESLFDGHAGKKVLSHTRLSRRLQDNLGASTISQCTSGWSPTAGTTIGERKSEPLAFAAGAVVGTERSETEKLLAAPKKPRASCGGQEFWS